MIRPLSAGSARAEAPLVMSPHPIRARRTAPIALLRLGLALAAGFGAGAPSAQEYALGHVIVRFKEERMAELGGARHSTPLELGLPEGSQLVESGLADWRRQQGGKHGHGEAPGSAWKDHFLLRLAPGQSPEECLDRLRFNPLIEYAELDYRATAASVPPNDPDFPLQWHHDNPDSDGRSVPADIRSIAAWGITQGSSNVVVAVLDTGCNGHLPEFAGRMLPGYDFVNRDMDPSDDNGHGTEVAGVLGANANNGLLVAGVDWHCRILPVKVLASDRSGLFSTMADGIHWAVEQGAQIISLSAGGLQSNNTLSNAVAHALARGVVFVAAAHNDGGGIRFPARMPGVIAVGATTATDRRASFSNFGPELSLVAPGTNIFTVGRFGVRQRSWGTSMAAPQVAGAAGLLLSVRPGLDPAQVRELLCAGADDQVGAPFQDLAGFDFHHGFGRLNVHAALVLARTRLELAPGPGFVRLSWEAPPNASTKFPYEIQFAEHSNGAWQSLRNPPSVVFAEGRATWVDDGSETGAAPGTDSQRFYRIVIRKEADEQVEL